MGIMPQGHIKKMPLSQNTMADLLCTIMILCRGTDEKNQACWAYMCIKPSMAQSFKDARDKGMFDLEDYGAIIESGDGIDPPEDIKIRMAREYGMNHNYEDGLLEALDKIKQRDILT